MNADQPARAIAWRYTLLMDRGTLVLASAETVRACTQEQRARFALCALGETHLRGCAVPVSVYEVRPATAVEKARPV
jgi:class 3 adenylate cyclase